MTEIFTEEAPELIGVGAEALVQNATRLGLTWVLRYGTVVTSDPLTVMVDSDSIAVSMVSLVGYLAVDARVSVLIVSSKVHFVIGFPPGDATRKNLIDLQYAAASANLTLSTTPTLVPDAQLVLTTPACTYDVDIAVDLLNTAFVAGTTLSGRLYVDGSPPNGTAHFRITAANGRAVVTQQYIGDLTAGEHTFEVRGFLSAVSGTNLAGATNTNLKVRLWG